MRQIYLTEKEKVETLIKELDNDYTKCFECQKLIKKTDRNEYFLLGQIIYMCKFCSQRKEVTHGK